MRWWALLLLAGVVAAEDDRLAKDVGNPALQKKINDAIDKGVAYLESIQRPEGYWSGPERATDLLATNLDHSRVGGMTALCLYALGASGVAKDDPAVVRGLNFVFEHKDQFDPGFMSATYANSCLVLALTRIDPVAYRTPLYEAADRLVEGQLSDGTWTYVLGPIRIGNAARAADRTAWRKISTGNLPPDNSNTQFAVLALWAAQEIADYKVPHDAWEKIRKHLLKRQEKDGGWSYRKGDRESTATMTAAGIVSLVYALVSLDERRDGLARARGHPAVKRALELLPLSPDARTPLGRGNGSWLNYYLVYSIERVGTVLGLGSASWYVPGAEWLVEQQREEGAWGGGLGFVTPEPQRTEDAVQYPYETSLALLFLTRASRHLVTTRGGGEAEGPVTLKDEGPDTLEGIFDLYVATRTKDREALLNRFARREAVGLVIGKLRDKRQPVREAAFELLTRLVERPFLFDPAATLEEREVMLSPIEAFWKEKGAALEWDAERARFVAQ